MFVINRLAVTKTSKVYDEAMDELANGNYEYAARQFKVHVKL